MGLHLIKGFDEDGNALGSYNCHGGCTGSFMNEVYMPWLSKAASITVAFDGNENKHLLDEVVGCKLMQALIPGIKAQGLSTVHFDHREVPADQVISALRLLKGYKSGTYREVEQLVLQYKLDLDAHLICTFFAGSDRHFSDSYPTANALPVSALQHKNVTGESDIYDKLGAYQRLTMKSTRLQAGQLLPLIRGEITPGNMWPLSTSGYLKWDAIVRFVIDERHVSLAVKEAFPDKPLYSDWYGPDSYPTMDAPLIFASKEHLVGPKVATRAHGLPILSSGQTTAIHEICDWVKTQLTPNTEVSV